MSYLFISRKVIIASVDDLDQNNLQSVISWPVEKTRCVVNLTVKATGLLHNVASKQFINSASENKRNPQRHEFQPNCCLLILSTCLIVKSDRFYQIFFT